MACRLIASYVFADLCFANGRGVRLTNSTGPLAVTPADTFPAMTLVALSLALSLLVWSFVLLRWGTVLAVCIVLLIAGTLFGPNFLHYDGPLQVSSERLLFGMLIPFFVIHRKFGWTDPKRLSRGDWLLLVFALYLLVSTLLGSGEFGTESLPRWLFYVAMPAGLYFIARGCRLQSHDLWWLNRVIMVLGGYLAVMAVFEAKGFQQFVFPRYVVDPTLWEFYGRGRGPLLNPSANGILMTAALGVALACGFHSGRLGRLGYGGLLLLLLLGCYCTLTRCVWMGAAAVVGLFLFLRLPRRLQVWSVVAMLMVGFVGSSTLGKSLLKIKRDKGLSAEASLQSIQLRPLLGIIAWEMFKDRPIMGHGYGRYLEHHRPYTEARDWNLPLATAAGYVQHNILLSLLADTGMIGVGLFVMLLAYWTRIGWQLYRRSPPESEHAVTGALLLALLIGYFVNGMFQDATIFPMIHLYLMMIAGVASAAHSEARREAHAAAPGRELHEEYDKSAWRPASTLSV